MSLQTWKEEFYPVPAKDVSEAGALDHSIQKWKGLTEENLEKHEVSKRGASDARGCETDVNSLERNKR